MRFPIFTLGLNGLINCITLPFKWLKDEHSKTNTCVMKSFHCIFLMYGNLDPGVKMEETMKYSNSVPALRFCI